jgi:hypothetical protein
MLPYCKIACLFFALFCPLIGQSQTPFTCKGQYYLSLTRSGSFSSGLYEVKISNDGSNIFLDTISSSIGLVLNGMGYRITDNLIYGMDPNTARLRKIGSDGVAIDLGVPTGIPVDRLYYAGDVSPDGRYLLLIGLGGTNPQIARVDLEDPIFQTTFVPLQDRTVGIVDIAFDPFTGILYGHDLRGKRMVIIDPLTGAVNTNFVSQPQVDQLGALFFDSFGNLYGYGAYETFAQDKFVSINKQTGEISLLSQGPISSGQDGCACPYTLELQKIVKPNIAYPCTEVVYDFIVSNGSGIGRSGISLHDTMPEGLTFKAVISNPFGGDVLLDGNILSMTNLQVPVGIDTVKILVEVGADALGLYRNQAILSGLPLALGSFTLSDDPFTFIEKDSTDLTILPLDLSFINEVHNTCPNDSVLIDATLHGISYLWSDGDTSAIKWLQSPGNYNLVVRSLCETKDISITLYNDLISVDIPEDTITVSLGEEALLKGNYQNIDENVTFSWFTTNNDVPKCIGCQNSEVLPLFDGYYYYSVTNSLGCVATDSVYIRVQKDRSVFSPNIISANGDGNNDNFYLFGNDLGSLGKYFRVYDRWGNLVFESTNFTLNKSEYGWDGTFLGRDVIEGVYTWVASMIYIDGFELLLHGDVTIIR